MCHKYYDLMNVIFMNVTVKPVLRGHCIKGSPVLSSHFSGSLEPKYNANEPVLRGHLS